MLKRGVRNLLEKEIGLFLILNMWNDPINNFWKLLFYGIKQACIEILLY